MVLEGDGVVGGLDFGASDSGAGDSGAGDLGAGAGEFTRTFF